MLCLILYSRRNYLLLSRQSESEHSARSRYVSDYEIVPERMQPLGNAAAINMIRGC